MKKIKALHYLLFLGFFYLTVPVVNGQKSSNYEVSSLKILVESKLDLLFTTIKIQGKPYKFLIDTGAPFVLFEKNKKKVKLNKSKKIKTRDSNQNVKKVRSVFLDDIAIGDLKYDQVRALLLNLDGPILNCLEFDGILGANLMANAVWQFHKDSHYVLIATDTTGLLSPDHDAQVMKLKGWQKSPYISVTINRDDPIDALFDTGFTNYFTLPSKHFNSLQSEFSNLGVKKFFGFGSEGAFGRTLETTTYISVDSLVVGDHIFSPASFHLDNDDNAKIGVKFLNDRVVTLDFINKMFYFSNQQAEASISAESFGFSPNIRNGQIIVGTIKRGSSLEKRISIGDLIVQVNDQELSDPCKDLLVLRNLMNSSTVLTFKIKTKNGIKEIRAIKQNIF